MISLRKGRAFTKTLLNKALLSKMSPNWIIIELSLLFPRTKRSQYIWRDFHWTCQNKLAWEWVKVRIRKLAAAAWEGMECKTASEMVWRGIQLNLNQVLGDLEERLLPWKCRHVWVSPHTDIATRIEEPLSWGMNPAVGTAWLMVTPDTREALSMNPCDLVLLRHSEPIMSEWVLNVPKHVPIIPNWIRSLRLSMTKHHTIKTFALNQF